MTDTAGRDLVTGATGLLGQSVVRRLVQAGRPVRALVRNRQAAQGLSDSGVELFVGDLSDPRSLTGVLDGVGRVFHCAARLGDWGPWSDFEQGIVLTTQHLVDQCLRSNVQRFVHVSSVAAYGHLRVPPPWTEAQPLGQHLWWWDYYAKAKMLAEVEAVRLGERTTVVRPTWIYGPGDRTILPRIIAALRAGRVTMLGRGANPLNLVWVDDVAAGVVAAGDSRETSGRVYNLCSEGQITQREFFDLLADELQLPRVKSSVPLQVALQFGFFSEVVSRLRHSKSPPKVTRHGISLLTRPTNFSIAAAKSTLGWQPKKDIRAGLQETLAWLRKEGLA